jgi:DNA-binding transcriptional LysR family regulator
MEDDVQASSLPEVNSRQLRAVLAVAEYRSFIAAAAFLKTSQPALTRTIKQIEAILGAHFSPAALDRFQLPTRGRNLLRSRSGCSTI